MGHEPPRSVPAVWLNMCVGAAQAQAAAAAAAAQRAEADARLDEVTALLEGERTHVTSLKVRCWRWRLGETQIRRSKSNVTRRRPQYDVTIA